MGIFNLCPQHESIILSHLFSPVEMKQSYANTPKINKFNIIPSKTTTSEIFAILFWKMFKKIILWGNYSRLSISHSPTAIIPQAVVLNIPSYKFYLFSSVQFSCSVLSASLRPHELQHARPPCPLSTPGVHSNSRPSGR